MASTESKKPDDVATEVDQHKKDDVTNRFLKICGPKIAKYLSPEDKNEFEIVTKINRSTKPSQYSETLNNK